MLLDIQTEENRWSFLFWRVNFGLAVLIVLGFSGVAFYFCQKDFEKTIAIINQPVELVKIVLPPKVMLGPVPEAVWKFQPGPISMDVIKKKGCVADGFLSEYGNDTKEMVKLIDRSECVYLHRALETWLKKPDFKKAKEIMQKVQKKPVVYGMFLAEAVRRDHEYEVAGGKDFDFGKMCRKGTQGKWTPDSCAPSIQSVEYRRYLKSITRQAMDLGIQSFLFGQVVLQDEHPNFENGDMKKVIDDMRSYAKSKNMDIIIGGQTDSITDEKYLRMFDYIEGGLGMGEDGQIENGACWSRMEDCWALLWHERYASKANHVLLHLDWSGLTWDDMGVFSRMTHKERIERLRYFYNFFTAQDMGFMMPYLAIINRQNEGCHGRSKGFYSPNKKYECKDEEKIREIMGGK